MPQCYCDSCKKQNVRKHECEVWARVYKGSHVDHFVPSRTSAHNLRAAEKNAQRVRDVWNVCLMDDRCKHQRDRWRRQERKYPRGVMERSMRAMWAANGFITELAPPPKVRVSVRTCSNQQNKTTGNSGGRKRVLKLVWHMLQNLACLHFLCAGSESQFEKWCNDSCIIKDFVYFCNKYHSKQGIVDDVSRRKLKTHRKWLLTSWLQSPH